MTKINKFKIYSVDLDPTVGAEMNKKRPCIVVSPDEMNAHIRTAMIVPLTSVARALPTRVPIKASPQSGLKNDSYAVIDQLKTVDKSRLDNLIGEISEAEKQQITSILLDMFAY